MTQNTVTQKPTRPATSIAPKVAGATLAAAVTVIAVWAVEATTGIAIPTEVQGAVTIVLAFVGGYIPRD